MDLKGTIENIAPTVAAAIGGPVGNIAMAVLKTVFQLHPDSPDAAVLDKVKDMTPEAALALTQAEQQFKIRLRELDIDETKLVMDTEKIDADDRANARAREISLHDWVTKSLALGIFILFAATSVTVMRVKIPVENGETVKANIEVMKLMLMTIIGYYFGSSAGSRVKDWISSRKS